MRKICYYPELTMITGSVTAALLMSQLEFWFKVTGGKNFYKFMEPCDHGYYKVGDSWQEELRMSSSEIRTAFKKIGIAYKSKKEFMEHEKDIFQGKMYASYYDRMRKMTFYFRNAGKVKEIFEQLDSENRNEEAQVIKEIETEEMQLGAEMEIDDLEGSSQSVNQNLSQTSSRNGQAQDGLLYIKDNRLNNKQNNRIKDIYNKQNIKDNRQESYKDLDIPYTEICNLYNTHLGAILGNKDRLEIYEKACVKHLWVKLGKRLIDFEKGFMKVAESSFLCGRIENKPFRVTFAWMLKGDHFIRILAGAYDDFKAQNTGVEARTMPNKIQQFNAMDSRAWDFDEIERLERKYIEQKIASMQSSGVCPV